ncbi:dienelactone hydrolase family protein [Sphingomonas sp. NFR15]|uniref:dienelactone hydrolase family protein n=1 Tax=Sphingomonas sp. NFR15 TaxID=1566282 RepID=UPI00088E8861|nr:dienelactone hydrolase family protein [Sphingomonas sp. NFR15]SDA32393.1 carboxymethylenebutenolidase [Sphingomonas sp. NFR15]
MTDNSRSWRDRAIQLYDAFTHEHRDRRALLRDMVALTGSVAAAEVLIAGIAAAPAAAAITDAADPTLDIAKEAYGIGPGKQLTGYFASPKGKTNLGSVIVFHENRGLTAHIEDVARRFALAGFRAVAPDFLSDQGGTPDTTNAKGEDKAREMIGKADLAAITSEAVATIGAMRARPGGNGKVAIVGFCWGGALVNRVAVAAGDALAAGVAYYGPAPDPAEAAQVAAPLLLHYAGKDTRVAATGGPWVAALKAAGKDVTDYTYEGVDHAFNNDTSAERYNAAAALLAWDRTIAFLHAHLDG